MQKYRTKPVEFEAMQWRPKDAEQSKRVQEWLQGSEVPFTVTGQSLVSPRITGRVQPTDWILKFNRGIFTTMMDVHFKEHNEPVEGDSDQRIEVFLDGDMWCALRGENLQEGWSCFGETPLEALDGWLKLYGPNGSALKENR